MFELAYATDTGSTHPVNDDRVLIKDMIYAEGHGCLKTEGPIIAAIFDGVGGEAYGFEAAQLAASCFAAKKPEELNIRSIKSQFFEANELIIQAQQRDAGHRQMSTTAAGVVISECDILAFNTGDSRIYRYRKPYLAQLSEDHTLAQQMKNLGISSDKTQEHVITRYLGGDVYKPYIFDGTDRNFDEDVYLLCSDGISDVISEEDFVNILGKEITSEEMCIELIAKAIVNGSEDNLSVIIIRRV